MMLPACSSACLSGDMRVSTGCFGLISAWQCCSWSGMRVCTPGVPPTDLKCYMVLSCVLHVVNDVS